MQNITRRTVTKAVWTAPIIMTAVAAPAAAASQPPPVVVPVCISPDRLLVAPIAGTTFKTNEGQGSTLVVGDGVIMTNTGSSTLRFVVGFWTNAGQEATLSILGNDTISLEAPKSGNKATVPMLLLAGESRTIKVSTSFADAKAEAHLVIDCQSFIFKSV